MSRRKLRSRKLFKAVVACVPVDKWIERYIRGSCKLQRSLSYHKCLKRIISVLLNLSVSRCIYIYKYQCVCVRQPLYKVKFNLKNTVSSFFSLVSLVALGRSSVFKGSRGRSKKAQLAAVPPTLWRW